MTPYVLLEIMTNEFCPNCNTLRNMTMTSTERDEKGEDGKVYKIITSSYHCDTCHTFVRSEDERIPLNNEEK